MNLFETDIKKKKVAVQLQNRKFFYLLFSPQIHLFIYKMNKTIKRIIINNYKT